MTPYRFLIGATAVAFTLSVGSAWAQGRPGGEGPSNGGAGGDSRPSGGGGGANAPVNTGGGGFGGGGGGSSSGGGGGSVGDAGGGHSAPSASPSAPSYEPPSRPSSRANNAQERRGGGGPATGRAVPRGSGGESPRGTSRMPSPNSSAGNDDRRSPSERAVPTYSRPREGRPTTGSAVDRQGPPVRRGGDGGYYNPYGYGRYWWPGYGFGLGYYYDPLWYDPYWYGGGIGYQGYGGYGGYASRTYRDTGSLRLKIKPRDAQVYVDGYFVGSVDSFDGLFQRLGIDAGGHRIEIRAEGYEPLQFEVLITPGETVTYKGELKRIQ